MACSNVAMPAAHMRTPEDSFMRLKTVERFEIHWDGQNISFPEGFTWEGEAQMTQAR